MIQIQRSDKTPSDEFEGLFDSRDSRLHESGGYDGHVAESSVYTKATMHPFIAGSVVALGVGGLLYALSQSRSAGETIN